MMKRTLAALLVLCLMGGALPALGEVYVKKTPPEGWQDKELLRITVFRTGEGDCMLLEAGGERMMVDGGPYKYREKLRDAMVERNIIHFKYLFSTHPHDDHIDGLRMLMAYGFEVEEFLSVFPKDQTDTEGNQKKAMAVLDEAGIAYRQVFSGDTLSLGKAELTVFNWPEGVNLNAQSAMIRVEYGDCAALLTADIVGETQKYFLDALDPALLKADVLKAPHHGITAIVPDFLNAVDPAYVFITNYKGDRSSKTGDQVERRKLPHQYSGDGTIVLECDGTDWYINQLRYQF